jgi:hypothetical protein
MANMSSPASPPAPAAQTFYRFPAMTEEAIRQARLRAFAAATAVSVVPYFVHLCLDAADVFSPILYYRGVPDLAFAGVVIAIAAYSNTIFSFVTLAGEPKRLGTWTFAFGFIVAFSSLGCFLQYVRAIHKPPSSGDFSELFFTALMFAAATLISAVILQYCFLSDECRWARNNLASVVGLTPRNRRG